MQTDKELFDNYTTKHGKVPSVDDPDLGEFSDYMRGNSSPLGAILLGVIAILIALAGLGAVHLLLN